MLRGDRRLLPGQKASARRVLLGRGSPDRAGAGSQASTRSGCGKAAAFTSTTDRRSRCPIRRRTSTRTRNPSRRNPAWAFLCARIAAVFSLACGAVLDVGICRYAGKGQSELGMLRTLWNLFRPGDVMLADRLMCTWTEMVMLKQRGVDCVCRLTSHRKADFRRGKRLGKDDHIVKWLKPTKPRSIDRETYDALPEFLMVRECRVRVEQPGFRVRDPHRRHDVAGRRRIHQGRSRTTLSGALERRAGSEIAETNAANGRLAMQDTGTGPEGDSGRTSWPTISSARSWPKPQPNTASNRERSASRERSKRSKPSSR